MQHQEKIERWFEPAVHNLGTGEKEPCFLDRDVFVANCKREIAYRCQHVEIEHDPACIVVQDDGDGETIVFSKESLEPWLAFKRGEDGVVSGMGWTEAGFAHLREVTNVLDA